MKNYLKITLLALIIVAVTLLVYKQRSLLRNLWLRMITHEMVYVSKQLKSTLNYRLYTPKTKGLDSQPLIVFLHGAGARGDDNAKQLGSVFSKLISKSFQNDNPSFVVAPQCPDHIEWVDRPPSTIPYDHYNQDEVPESAIMKMIHGLIYQLVEEHSIDTNRIYITGFSMGATGVWDMTTRYPDLFAAAVPMSGVSDTSKAYLLKNTPIWAFHGEADFIAPPKLNINMVEAVNKNGGAAKITLIENGGHGSEGKAFSLVEFPVWFFSQRKSK